MNMFASYVKTTPLWNSVPPYEIRNSILNGLLAHFGPMLGFCFLAEINHFDSVLTLISFISMSILGLVQILWLEKIAPSVDLNLPQKNDIFRGLLFVFLKGFGIGGSMVALCWWLCAFVLPKISSPIWLAIALTVLAADLIYYFIHRFLNHSRVASWIFRWFRKNHTEHHAIKSLDFLRGNHSSLMDTAFTSFQIPTAVVGTLLGLDLTQTLVAYAILLSLQSTHHVNFTFNIGWLRFIFVDNHNHKLHHCPRGYLVNFAAVFSLWDRFFGTCYENWHLSANYLKEHRLALPIQRKMAKS